MTISSFAKLLPVSVLLLGGAAFAQGAGIGAAGTSSGQATSTTSSTESGTNVAPSTAIQKQNSGRSSAGGGQLQGSSNAAGAPGIEGRSGTQSGPAPELTQPPPK
jgi:hypothetical protein